MAAFRRCRAAAPPRRRQPGAKRGRLRDIVAHQAGNAEELARVPADTDVAWTGRTMKVPWFAEHMREELVLHGWDITGDDAAARVRLSEPWMTTHSVFAVGRPLLAKGAKGLAEGERIEARLRVVGTDDVFVSADADQTAVALAEPEGPATLDAMGSPASRSGAHMQPRRARNPGPGAQPA